VTDLRAEQDENMYDLMSVNSESISNNINESKLEFEKQKAERIWT
jgi:hypothetical protein